MIYNLRSGKDVICFSGASMFFHHHQPVDCKDGLVDGKVVLTVLAADDLAEKTIMNNRQFESVLEDSPGSMLFRNYSYELSELEQETVKIENVLQDVESIMEKIEALEDDKKKKQACIEDKCPIVWYKGDLKMDSRQMKGGSFKVISQRGPDDRLFIYLQNTEISA